MLNKLCLLQRKDEKNCSQDRLQSFAINLAVLSNLLSDRMIVCRETYGLSS
jgi:hypothetical protein